MLIKVENISSNRKNTYTQQAHLTNNRAELTIIFFTISLGIGSGKVSVEYLKVLIDHGIVVGLVYCNDL